MKAKQKNTCWNLSEFVLIFLQSELMFRTPHRSASMDGKSQVCTWDDAPATCQSKRISDWEKILPLRNRESVPLDLHWSFNALSLSLASHSPTHLPLLIISCSLERQGGHGETGSTVSDSISWLCASCPSASPLPVALVPLMSAGQKNERCPSGNNPVCKISLQEMGFLTCRLNTSEIIVCD